MNKQQETDALVPIGWEYWEGDQRVPFVKQSDAAAIIAAKDAEIAKVSNDLFYVQGELYRLNQENDELRAQLTTAQKEAKLYQQAERACRELPHGWEITVNIELDAGTVSLFNDEGDQIEFPSDCDGLANELSDAIDQAMGGNGK